MTQPKDATLHTRCPACRAPITWEGALDLDHELECPRCGLRGTLRDLMLGMLRDQPSGKENE